MKNLILLLALVFISERAFSKEIIYVVDTEINFNGTLKDFKCTKGHYSAIPNLYSDTTVHGTKMSNVIIKGLSSKDVCLVNIKVFNLRSNAMQPLLRGLNYLKSQTPGIINMSLDGPIPDFMEYILLKQLLKLGFKLSLTSGNNGINLAETCRAFPACYFTKKTANVKISSNYAVTSNKGGPTTHYDNLTGGTSYSTANTTNKWIKEILNNTVGGK